MVLIGRVSSTASVKDVPFPYRSFNVASSTADLTSFSTAVVSVLARPRENVEEGCPGAGFRAADAGFDFGTPRGGISDVVDMEGVVDGAA